MDALDDFYTDHPFVDWYKTTYNAGRRTFSTFFRKDRYLDLLSILRMPVHTNMSCKRAKFWTTRSEMTGHSFLVLIQKLHKLCFENSSCKLSSFNNSENTPWAKQVCRLLKFQLCMICGSNVSWIKVRNAPEMGMNVFNFSLTKTTRCVLKAVRLA